MQWAIVAVLDHNARLVRSLSRPVIQLVPDVDVFLSAAAINFYRIETSVNDVVYLGSEPYNIRDVIPTVTIVRIKSWREV